MLSSDKIDVGGGHLYLDSRDEAYHSIEHVYWADPGGGGLGGLGGLGGQDPPLFQRPHNLKRGKKH